MILLLLLQTDESVSSSAMAKGLKNKPPALPESSQGKQKLQMMTQSTYFGYRRKNSIIVDQKINQQD